MARPSYRGMEQVDDKNLGDCFHTAIYIRLSYESYYTESESIENQKLLIGDFLQRHKGFVLYEQFIDDGKTGTNFKRPAFERMMKAIREGSINCIIVKDVSRFGRNHVEVGDYIERIFPFLGVRFISVNDGYDSFNETCDKDQLLLSVKNLMHEMYARDVSKKICSSIKIKQKTGEFYRTTTIPYGYKMGEKKYELDEQTATVVRRIFHSFATGDTVYHICSVLNQEGIASPKEYARNKSLYVKENTDSCWFISTVNRMLQNEVYVGNMVRHKMEQKLYNDEKAKVVEEKDWIRVENTHPAIIDKIIFEQVQRKLMERKSISKGKDEVTTKRTHRTYHKKYSYNENIFKNKIFCGECRAAMTRVNVKTVVNKDAFIYKGFSCGLHRNFVSKCSHKETIEEDVLCSMVNKIVVDQTKLYKGIRSLIERNGRDIFDQERTLIAVDKHVVISAIKKLEKARFSVLEEYHQGEIDKYQVMMRRSGLQALIMHCNEQYQLLEERMMKVKRLEETYRSLMYEWLRYMQNPKITKEIIPLFVERIDVYSKRQVVIKMKNIDYMKDIIEMVYKDSESDFRIE